MFNGLVTDNYSQVKESAASAVEGMAEVGEGSGRRRAGTAGTARKTKHMWAFLLLEDCRRSKTLRSHSRDFWISQLWKVSLK